MITGRNFRFDSNRNDLSLRPDGLGDGAVLKGYILGTDQSNFSFLLEEAEGGIYQFKHNATGLYLEYISGGTIQLKPRVVGSIQQNFLIEGSGDTNRTIRYQGEFDTYFKLTSDSDGTTVETAAIGSGQDSYFSLVEISINQTIISPPTPSKLFRHMNKVPMSNVQPNATIKTYMNGSLNNSQTAGSASTFELTLPPLQVGDDFQFEQVYQGVTSAKSSIMRVNRCLGVRLIGGKYYAAEKLVTDSTGDNPDNWIGNKGEILSAGFNTKAEAEAAIIALNYTSKVYSNEIGTIVNPPVEVPPTGNCEETLSSGQKSTLDSWADSKSSDYGGKFVGFIYRNNELWVRSYGDINRTTQLSIASVGKHFASTVLLKLVDEGKLSLNSKTSMIPSMAANGKGNITLKQLMSHTAGWEGVSYGTNGSDPWEDQSGLTTASATDAVAANHPLVATPGTYYSYGGVHWLIAARMAEIATGQKWADICQTRIWGPLGMSNTSYNQAGFTPSDNPQIHAGLRTTMDDWAKFMQMRLKLGVFGGQRILSEAAILSQETSQTGLGTSYGFGLYPEPSNNESFHHGATGCVAFYNRTKKYAGAIFTIQYGGTNIDENDEFRGLVRSTMVAAPTCS